MVTYQSIKQFLQNTTFAVAGVSRNGKKFGNMIYRALRDKKFTVYAINPNTDSIEGDVCYRSLKELPVKELGLIVVAPKNESLAIIKEAFVAGIKSVWLQQGAYTEEAVSFAQQNGMNVIYKQCVFMFLDPVNSIHKFHRGLAKFFGSFPK